MKERGNCLKFVRKVYEIHSDKLKDGQSLSLTLLSDLHLAEYGPENELLIQEICRINPDAVVLAGDMVTGKEGYDTQTAEKLLCKLARKYPVYYALGNHEEKIKVRREVYGDLYDKYCKKVMDAGVHLLINERQKVTVRDISVCFYGVELPLEYYQRLSNIQLEEKKMYQLMGEPETDCYNILLAHHPRYAKTYFSWGADLTLSGHIHGGVMRLGKQACISPDLRIFPRYGYGKFTQEDQVMVVSGGLGEHTIPFRLFNPKD